jgi:HTH-type transcriptional regulator/antitoxin HigA
MEVPAVRHFIALAACRNVVHLISICDIVAHACHLKQSAGRFRCIAPWGAGMETIGQRKLIEELTTHFQALTSIVPLHPVRTGADYGEAAALLNRLLDSGAASDGHPLSDLVDTLGVLIGEFDAEQYPQADVSALDTLRFLMEQHNLTEAELPEIGSQGVVSEVLTGKRELNVQQIRALSARFAVPASLFI